MKITQWLLLGALTLTVLSGCGTLNVDSSFVTETELAATQQAQVISDEDPGQATASDPQSGATTVIPTAVAETADVQIDDIELALGDPIVEHLQLEVGGTVYNSCYTISDWSQELSGDRLIVQSNLTPVAGACAGTAADFRVALILNQHGLTLEQLAGGSLFLDVNGVVQPLRPLLAPLLPPVTTPVASPMTTPETQVISTSEFEALLQEAILTHNYEWLAQLMDDPFSIALWRSEGYSATPEQMINDFRHTYLTEDRIIEFNVPAPDLTAALGPDRDILDIWDPGCQRGSGYL